jgi:hypothetical protein
MTTREQIAVAFWNLIEGAADFGLTSRRFVAWDQVTDNGQLPFLTMLKTGEERARKSDTLPMLTLKYHVFVYTSAGFDQNGIPETAMNALLDAIDAAAAPSTPDDRAQGKQTLGGLVDHCYPLGSVFIDTGDVDGKGVAAIPFEILVPWSNP